MYFWNFVIIKVAASKLNCLGFYCKLDFLIGKSEKAEMEMEIEYELTGYPAFVEQNLDILAIKQSER